MLRHPFFSAPPYPVIFPKEKALKIYSGQTSHHYTYTKDRGKIKNSGTVIFQSSILAPHHIVYPVSSSIQTLTVGPGISPDHACYGSRALPPVGKRSLPWRLFIHFWYIVYRTYPQLSIQSANPLFYMPILIDFYRTNMVLVTYIMENRRHNEECHQFENRTADRRYR